MRGKKSYLARRRRRWLAAFLAVLWWRPVAVSLLTGGGSKQRRCCLKRRREGFFLFPSPLFPSLFFFFFGFLSPCFPFFRFSLLPLPFLSLLVFSVLLPSPLFFSFFFSPVCSLPLLRSWGSIYRAKGVALYCSHGEQPAGRPLGATAKVRPPSPVFWQVRGGWSAIVSGRWAPGERVAGKNSN